MVLVIFEPYNKVKLQKALAPAVQEWQDPSILGTKCQYLPIAYLLAGKLVSKFVPF